MKITPQVVRELLHYNPETGVFVWRDRGSHWFKQGRGHRAWNARYAGNRAGRVWINSRTGYRNRRIRISGQDCLEHRLAWLYVTGEQPPIQIDHRDRDGTNNAWLNLRASTPAHNSKNQSKYRNNSSGVPCVYWASHVGRWQARCWLEGKGVSLGYFEEIEDAERAVKEFRAIHGFDPGHGTHSARCD